MWFILRVEDTIVGKDILDINDGIVATMRNKVKEFMPNSLLHCDSGSLRIFDGEEAYKNGTESRLGMLISDLKSGKIEDDPVIVMAPPQLSSQSPVSQRSSAASQQMSPLNQPFSPSPKKSSRG